MALTDELLDYIFDGRESILYDEFTEWVRDSRRFRTFADGHRNKIRSKLRAVRDEGGLWDLRAELETAALLLREERFNLAYESYAASKQRGPDFTVTFKSHTLFNVEVRRIRNVEPDDASADARIGKLVNVLSDKVRQMPPSIANFLWLTAEREISGADLEQAVHTIRRLFERRAETYFADRGYESAAAFARFYRRLSGVVVRYSGECVIWLNPTARHPVPAAIVTAIRRL